MFRLIKAAARRVLPPTALGIVDFVRPSTRNTWGGPLNGQRGRQQMFREIAQVFSPTAIVETGTYRGDTTLFLRSLSEAPVHTVEAHPRYFTYARLRFLGRPGIVLSRDDSRTFLERLRSDAEFPSSGVLFYLDAHWNDDLPLVEELRIINDGWTDWVVVIDDFHVPDDSGFAFDDYGPDKSLGMQLVPPDVLAKAEVFWPAISAQEETGARRGCVVLASTGASSVAMRGVATLRPG